MTLYQGEEKYSIEKIVNHSVPFFKFLQDSSPKDLRREISCCGIANSTGDAFDFFVSVNDVDKQELLDNMGFSSQVIQVIHVFEVFRESFFRECEDVLGTMSMQRRDLFAESPSKYVDLYMGLTRQEKIKVLTWARAKSRT